MTTPSPDFSFTGFSVLEKGRYAAGATIEAQLESTAGVRSVQWEVERTDELSSPASYTLAPSGTFGETVQFTAGSLGTTGVLKCTVNGGIDPQSENESPAMSATAKWYVPNENNDETMSALELEATSNESNSSHGAVAILNAFMRALTGRSSGGHKFFIRFLSATTPNATPVVMDALGSVSGSLKGIALADDSSMVAFAVVNARRTDANNESAGYQGFVTLDRNTGTVAQVGAASLALTVIGEDTAAWSADFVINNTDKRLDIQATGEAAKNIIWSGFVIGIISTG